MKIIDFLKICDGTGLKVIVYGSNSNTSIWDGWFWDIPWHIALLELETDKEKLDYGSPIDYRQNLNDGKPGLVMIVKEDD